jgi:hypothetical protein
LQFVFSAHASSHQLFYYISGKTLAFLIPILNHLLEQHDEQDNMKPAAVQALIMTPTRELATQIHDECDKLLPNQCVTLVGGIAMVKQVRLLKTKKPSVVIATPGRLWAMVSFLFSRTWHQYFSNSQGRQTRYVGAKTILLILRGQIPFLFYICTSVGGLIVGCNSFFILCLTSQTHYLYLLF